MTANELQNKNDQYHEFLSVEDYLLELRKFGKPILFSHDKWTWSCKISMQVTGEGITFTINSGYKCRTPLDATRTCYKLMIESLKQLGD